MKITCIYCCVTHSEVTYGISMLSTGSQLVGNGKALLGTELERDRRYQLNGMMALGTSVFPAALHLLSPERQASLINGLILKT